VKNFAETMARWHDGTREDARGSKGGRRQEIEGRMREEEEEEWNLRVVAERKEKKKKERKKKKKKYQKKQGAKGRDFRCDWKGDLKKRELEENWRGLE